MAGRKGFTISRFLPTLLRTNILVHQPYLTWGGGGALRLVVTPKLLKFDTEVTWNPPKSDFDGVKSKVGPKLKQSNKPTY